MSKSNHLAAESLPAVIAITTLCDNFDLLSSDYGILTGAFPLDNPAIKACFVSRGIITSMELTELDDEVRELKSRTQKDAKKNKYRETPRRRHEDLRKNLESKFEDLVRKLSELKGHLEATFTFRYLPNCSYRLLGELGKPAQQQIGPPRIFSQSQRIAAGSVSSVRPQANHSVDTMSGDLSPAVKSSAGTGYVQTSLTNKRRYAHPSTLSERPLKRGKTTNPARSVAIPAFKSSRPRRLVTMGIAGKIANTILDSQQFDHPFGTLAPEVKTPQQIWEHRFPNGYSQPDPAAEYIRTLEELLASSSRKIRMISDTKIGKELNKAKARRRQLAKELNRVKEQNVELKNEKTEQPEMQEPQMLGITKYETAPPHRTVLPDQKPKKEKKRPYDRHAPKDDLYIL